MKKIVSILIILLAVLEISAGPKKTSKDTPVFRYEIECAGNGVRGTYLVRVWSYAKQAQAAMDQSRINAVHGVIFKGFGAGDGCAAQKPLATEPECEQNNQQFFAQFFTPGGEALNYASVVPGSYEIIKCGKEFKVGAVVTVNKDELRRALEKAEVIKALKDGF